MTVNAKNLAEVKQRDDVAQGDFVTVDFAFTQASAKELARVAKALGSDAPEGYIAGWASTADIDHAGHRVMSGAFSESIRERGLSGPRGVKLLSGHDWSRIIGAIKVLEYRGNRLWLEGQINPAISYARDVYEVIKTVEGLNFSVGFFLQDYRWVEAADKTEILQIDRGELIEVSVVPMPMNDAATMEFYKSRDGAASPKTVAEFEKSLVARGLFKCRNDARRFTQEVKSIAHLFHKGQADDPASEAAPPIAPPVLALEQINELSASIAKMKQALAPAASR